MNKYWITLTAQEHVNIVKEKGYTQVNMGPKEPLEKMSAGDWILYYSPTLILDNPKTVCQKFTAFSYILDDHIYPQYPKNPIRWRRDVEFFNCIPQHAKNFHHSVSFLQQYENWLDAFIKPVFEIPRNDFIVIAQSIIIPSQDKCLLF